MVRVGGKDSQQDNFLFSYALPQVASVTTVGSAGGTINVTGTNFGPLGDAFVDWVRLDGKGCTNPQVIVEQADAAGAVIRCIDRGDTPCGPNIFYVDGPAGAGKTFLYAWLLRHVRASGGIALAVAMSGA